MESVPVPAPSTIRPRPELTVYSLTYCEPCERASGFLREHGYSFNHVEVDELPPAPRFEVKRRITPLNIRSMKYPVLSINDNEFIYGFDPGVWLDRINAAQG